MKSAPIKLIYHSMHKRPMPGCLPLFFILAAVVAAAGICVVKVVMPGKLPPPKVGHVYYRSDEMTRFQVRQNSALPLRLPAYADPAAGLCREEHPLPLYRQISPLPAPQVETTPPHDSAVLDAEQLLALPPAAEAAEKGGEP